MEQDETPARIKGLKSNMVGDDKDQMTIGSGIKNWLSNSFGGKSGNSKAAGWFKMTHEETPMSQFTRMKRNASEILQLGKKKLTSSEKTPTFTLYPEHQPMTKDNYVSIMKRKDL